MGYVNENSNDTIENRTRDLPATCPILYLLNDITPIAKVV